MRELGFQRLHLTIYHVQRCLCLIYHPSIYSVYTTQAGVMEFRLGYMRGVGTEWMMHKRLRLWVPGSMEGSNMEAACKPSEQPRDSPTRQDQPHGRKIGNRKCGAAGVRVSPLTVVIFRARPHFKLEGAHPSLATYDNSLHLPCTQEKADRPPPGQITIRAQSSCLVSRIICVHIEPSTERPCSRSTRALSVSGRQAPSYRCAHHVPRAVQHVRRCRQQGHR